MLFDIAPLHLYKHPTLKAFLDATLPEDISSTCETLINLPPYPVYRYTSEDTLRLHVTKNSISVFDICVAQGKLEHLQVLLTKTTRSPIEHKNNDFYHDLMLEAVTYHQLRIIDFLAKSCEANFHNPKKIRHFLRLAISHGYLDIVNQLIELAQAPITINDFENTLLRCALESGHLDIVNRLLEIPEIKSVIGQCPAKLLISAVKSSSLVIVTRILIFDDIMECMNQDANLDQILSAAINTCHPEIFNILYFHISYTAVPNREPKRDLLCLAALKGNDHVINILLGNRTVVRLAIQQDFYRRFVGEGLTQRAQTLGIDTKPEILSVQSAFYRMGEAIAGFGQLSRFFDPRPCSKKAMDTPEELSDSPPSCLTDSY